jgi:hypothetical protein
MTDMLKEALVGDLDRLHQRLFYAICSDLTVMCTTHQNVISVKAILSLVEKYSVAEYNAQKPEGGI